MPCVCFVSPPFFLSLFTWNESKLNFLFHFFSCLSLDSSDCGYNLNLGNDFWFSYPKSRRQHLEIVGALEYANTV